jgi:hypothetical protein
MPRAAPHPVDRATPVEAGVTDRAVPVDPDPLAPAPADLGPVDPHRVVTAPVALAPVDPHRVVTAPADRADRVITAPADPADRVITAPADLAVPVAPAPGCTAPADLAVPAARGMATTSAATSTAPRGVMDPHPGDRVHHRGRTGTDRSHRLGGGGGMVPSTTGATRKTRCGIPSSTSGASTSSESGSRCNESPHTTPASLIGEAGVVLIRLTAHPSAAQHTWRVHLNFPCRPTENWLRKRQRQRTPVASICVTGPATVAGPAASQSDRHFRIPPEGSADTSRDVPPPHTRVRRPPDFQAASAPA